MKLIKMKNGYVNVNMLESYVVVEHEGYCDIVAYSPLYGDDGMSYPLGKCVEEYNAYQRLKALAEWLANGEFGIFDVMHIWESDDE